MSKVGISPSLAFDAFDATEEQLDVLDDRFMSLLVHTDLLVAQGYEVTTDTKHALLRVVTHMRAVRRELLSLKFVYRVIRDRSQRTAPS